MNAIRRLPALLSLVMAVGCASTEVSDRDYRIGDELLVQPRTIHVYPFAASLADVPQWAGSAGRYVAPAAPQTAEEVRAGRELGKMVARALAENIRDMGLDAVQATSATMPTSSDLMIVGYFGAIEAGDRRKRMMIGFGSGAAELTTIVDVHQMTATGPRLLGEGTVDSRGSKSPGAAGSMVMLAATGNPVGLVVSSTAKLVAEQTGSSRIEGAAKRTADLIADELGVRFREQGWIE